MFEIDRWAEIFQSIRKNKLRTFLGAFTVALGIFIFTVLFGMGNGLKNTFKEFFEDDATNTVVVYSGRTTKAYKGFKEGRRIQFKTEDYELLKDKLGSRIEYITPRVFRGVNARYKREAGSYTVRGVNQDDQYLEKTIVEEGRYIDQKDIKNKSRVVVIGRMVKKDLFKDQEALGQFLQMNGINYKIIGVFSDAGGDNEERTICAPYSTLQLIYKNSDDINQINLSFNKEIGVNGAKQMVREINSMLREKYAVERTDKGGIRIRSVFDDYEQNMQFANLLQFIVLWIGIGTLFAGAISIGNIMVFVVKERTKELGIRKALGATPGSIVGLILQEAILITSIAGYAGLLIAVFALSRMGDRLKDYFITNPEVSTSTIVSATIILIIVGAIAGFIPARRAAKIKPVVAMRED